MQRRRGNATALCRKGDPNPHSNVGYQGGVENGVELIGSRYGHYTYRVGSLHSGNAAHATEKPTHQVIRELEQDLEHVQRKLKGD